MHPLTREQIEECRSQFCSYVRGHTPTEVLPIGSIHDLCDMALSALPQEQIDGAGEAVAWMTAENPPRVASTYSRNGMFQAAKESYCIPLYAAPAALPDRRGLVDALQSLLDANTDLQYHGEPFHSDCQIREQVAKARALLAAVQGD